MPLDFSGGIFSKFLNLHIEYLGSNLGKVNWEKTGVYITPFPLAGPKEQSTPNPRTWDYEIGAAYAPIFAC